MRFPISSRFKRSFLIILLPLLTFVLLLSGYLWMWAETNILGYKLVKSTSSNIIEEVDVRLETLLYERSKDLAHLASLFQNYNEKASEERFLKDASGMMSREKLYYSLGKINNQGIFDIRIPAEVDSFPYILQKIPYQFYLQKLSTQSPSIISYPVKLNDSTKVLVVLRAIFNSDSSRITGAITGVLVVDILIDRIKVTSQPSNYRLKMSIDDHLLYSNVSDTNYNKKYSKSGSAIITLKIMGKIWKIESAPLSKSVFLTFFYQNNQRLFINIISSVLVSILLGITLFEMLKSKRIQQQLAKSEKRYRLITEHAKDIIYRMILPEGRYEYISPVCESVTGYSAEQFYSTPNFLQQIISPDFRSIFEEYWDNLKKGVIPAIYEYKIIHKNGHTFWLQQKNTPISDSKGLPYALEGVITDITFQKNDELERERLIKDLEEKNNDLERFIYIISHELKTPLITIKGFLGYIEEEAMIGDLPQLHQDITRIITATETMQRQLNNLIEINKIGRNKSKAEIVNTYELVQGIIDKLKPVIEEHKILVKLGKLPDIVGYSNEIEELFQNIVENAIRFSSNQPQPIIQIDTITQNSEIVFFIRDNGIGIEEQYTNRIFGLFNKLDPHSEGTGAGLAIAKRVVEHHKGWISVKSEGPGKGSTFFFKLPITK